MAAQDSATTASVEEKKITPPAKKKIFGELKKPDLIIYRLVKRNDKIRDDTPPYPPYKRFPNYDLIQWEGGTRAIRWLPGFTSIFVDEQEAGNRVIPENVLNNPNNRFEIIDGEIKVRPHERTKLQFLDLCNRNVDSPNRTGTTEGIFSRVSEQKSVEKLAEKQVIQKDAIEKAFNADEAQIAFHAKYLGIPVSDSATGASRTFEAIQADYRQKAVDSPADFLKTYDDEDLKLKYRIELALERSIIALNVIPGKAVIAATKEEICDVPVTTDISQVVNTLFLFSQTTKGVSFLKKMSEVEA